ncbi:MAG: porin family protein [Sphingomonadales bacterium]|nr:MAG: porin family protein [Sphingomonadales bacterium]
MKLLALSAASILAIAAPAFAQDAEFDGPYVGASVGYSFGANDKDETIRFDRDLNGSFGDTVVTAAAGAPNAFSPGFCGGAANTNAPAGGCAKDKRGFTFAARAGYDMQMGSFVVGAVAEIGKARVRDSVSAYSTTPASYTMTREFDLNAGLRLRAGYVAGSKTLIYATGGLAYAKIDHRFATTNTANSFTGRGKDDAWGYAAGGGIEHKLGGNVSVGVEYLYTSLKDDKYVVRAGAGTAPATNPFLLAGAGGTDFRRSDERFDHHAVRATVAYRF